MRKHVPNFITSLNLLSGCIAVVFAFNGQLSLAALFIGAGAFFDFIDGFAARMLRVNSGIGKELDSLADVITFGLVPGVLIYQLMQSDLNGPGIYASGYNIAAFIAFLIPVFSALRLAKFNTDTRQEEVFYGLPTPASAIFIGSLPLILDQKGFLFGGSAEGIHELITNYYFLASLTVLISWLMVSEIRLFSLKFKSFSWNANRIKYLFIASGIVLFILFQFVAIPLLILLYIALSVIFRERA